MVGREAVCPLRLPGHPSEAGHRGAHGGKEDRKKKEERRKKKEERRKKKRRCKAFGFLCDFDFLFTAEMFGVSAGGEGKGVA